MSTETSRTAQSSSHHSLPAAKFSFYLSDGTAVSNPLATQYKRSCSARISVT